MREIVFRGKSKETGAWVCGDLFYKDGLVGKEDDHFYILNADMMGISEREVIPDTVGQYTGCKDKKGVKIFEGDIVRYTDEYSCVKTVPVVWGGEYYPAFDLAVELYDCANSLVELLLDSDAMVEVIGNIHDNPELAIKE
jgi:uncharacterized phage protein (TIGR01671 family)